MKAQLMAIGNVTPDSFYASSRLESESALVEWAHRSIAEGASILDIGACSTRPGSEPADEATEWVRLEPALRILRAEVPDATLSIDTFRPGIARRAMEQFGELIINDVSGGCEEMYEVVRAFDAPYIWTLRGDLDWPKRCEKMHELRLILDPGLGFTGGVENDYACLRGLETLQEWGYPIVVGVSRKSMVYKPLGLTPETCLSATQVLHLYALEHGATILRVHDVKEAAQTVEVWERISS